jgi:hypothetical protein
MRSLRRAIGMSTLLSLGTVMAAEEAAVPPASDEFLEYLGSWDGNDEEWLMVARADSVDAGRPRPTVEPRRDADARPVADADDGIVQE